MTDRIFLDEIRYTQDSVSCNFYDGYSIFEPSPHIHEPLMVTYYNGNCYSLNNRTQLSKLKNGHKQTYVKVIPYKKCKTWFHRKWTGNGDTPRVRGCNNNSEEESSEDEDDEYDSEEDNNYY